MRNLQPKGIKKKKFARCSPENQFCSPCVLINGSSGIRATTPYAITNILVFGGIVAPIILRVVDALDLRLGAVNAIAGMCVTSCIVVLLLLTRGVLDVNVLRTFSVTTTARSGRSGGCCKSFRRWLSSNTRVKYI